MLLMYAVSAVQMSHPAWFAMKPATSERTISMRAGYTDGRALARELMNRTPVRGEIDSVRATPAGFNLRIAVPGTVNDVTYDRSTGAAHVRSSVSGFMGMLNRLHHAAGLWHTYRPLWLWAAVSGLISLATLVLVFTGVWMWWRRREERFWGTVLLVSNLAFSIAVLTMLRRSGP
jgi:hypothetical protein